MSAGVATLSAARLPLFETGRLYVAPGARHALIKGGADVALTAMRLLADHVRGRHGSVLDLIAERNARAIAAGSPDEIFSSYWVPEIAGPVWVITNAGHTMTTVLLPEEF